MNSTALRVSVVLTTYRRASVVKRALGSVLAQSYRPIEIIVVEDGSNSGLPTWIKQNGLEKRITYLHHDCNRGLGASRNSGVAASSGDLVAFMDDDDEWEIDKIAKQVSHFNSLTTSERQNIGVIYCGARVVQADGRTLYTMSPRLAGDLRTAIVDQGITTIPSSAVLPGAALKKLGAFDHTLRSSIDHDLFMLLADSGYQATYVDEPLVLVHDRSGRPTMMSDPINRLAGVRGFLEKWSPTFRDWMGVEAADRFVLRYYLRVAGTLSAVQFAEGAFGYGLDSAREMVRYLGPRPRIFFHLPLLVAKEVARRRFTRIFVAARDTYQLIKS